MIAILTLVLAGACGFDEGGLGAPPIADASTADAPALGPDGDPIDASAPDAMPPDAMPPDAMPPDAAPPCGHLGEACCAPDNACALGVCLSDICVSLSR